MKILVVDPDPQTRETVRRVVRRDLDGTTVDAETSLDALQRLEKDSFQLALFEADLPTMSGVRLLDVVRRSPRTAALGVVMLTSRTDEATIRSLVQLGVAGVLAKPLDPVALSRRLGLCLQPHLPKPPMQAPALADHVHYGPETILVADGDPHFRHFATDALRGGRRIVQAATGAAALKLALLHRPTIVLVGQNLGLLGADMLVSELRAVSNLSGTRVVAVPPTNESGPFSTAAYDGVVGRTFVSDVFRKEVAALSRPLGPMTRLLAAYPMLPTDLSNAVSQVCGMMMEMEVALVPSRDAKPGATVRARQSVTASANQLAFRIDVTASMPDAQIMTSRLRAVEPATVTEDAACAMLGELTEIISGRLRHSMGEAGIPLQCGSPATHVAQGLPAERSEDETSLHFAAVDGTVRLQLTLAASSNEADLPIVA